MKKNIEDEFIYDLTDGASRIITFIYDDGNIYFKKKYVGYSKEEARKKFKEDLYDEGRVQW